MDGGWIFGGIQAMAALGFLSAGCHGLLYEERSGLLTPFTPTWLGYRSPIASAISSLSLGLTLAMSSVSSFVTVNTPYYATGLAVGILGLVLAGAKERVDRRGAP
jgi:hypothetical protein